MVTATAAVVGLAGISAADVVVVGTAGLEGAVAGGADFCLLVAAATRFAHGEASVVAESPEAGRSAARSKRAGVFVVAGRVGGAIGDSMVLLVAQGEGSVLAVGA